jgi:hypothetical protein
MDPKTDPKTAMKDSGEKKICCHTFVFGAINFTKLNYFYFLTKKLSLSSQKYGFGIRDRRSGKNLFLIPDPGVKKAPDPGSGSATLPEIFYY